MKKVSKWLFLLLTWAFALLVSFGLRLWGAQHPEAFVGTPAVVFSLLFGPSIFLGIWLIWFGLRDREVD